MYQGVNPWKVIPTEIIPWKLLEKLFSEGMHNFPKVCIASKGMYNWYNSRVYCDLRWYLTTYTSCKGVISECIISKGMISEGMIFEGITSEGM